MGRVDGSRQNMPAPFQFQGKITKKQNPTQKFSSAVSNAWNNLPKSPSSSSSTPPLLEKYLCLFCSNLVIIRKSLEANSSSEEEELLRGQKLKILCKYMSIESNKVPARCPKKFCTSCEAMLERFWGWEAELKKIHAEISKRTHKIQTNMVMDEFVNKRADFPSDPFMELRKTILENFRQRRLQKSQKSNSTFASNSGGDGKGKEKPFDNFIDLGLSSPQNIDESTSDDEDESDLNYEDETDELPGPSRSSNSSTSATTFHIPNEDLANIILTNEEVDESSEDEEEEEYEQGREEFGGDGELLVQKNYVGGSEVGVSREANDGEVDISSWAVPSETVSRVASVVSGGGEGEVEQRGEEVGGRNHHETSAELNDGNNDADMNDVEEGEGNEMESEEHPQPGPSRAARVETRTSSQIEIKKEAIEVNEEQIDEQENDSDTDSIQRSLEEVYTLEQRRRRWFHEGVEVYNATGARPGMVYLQCSLCIFSIPLPKRLNRAKGQNTPHRIMKAHIINVHRRRNEIHPQPSTNTTSEHPPIRGPGRPLTNKTCKICQQTILGYTNLLFHMKTHKPSSSRKIVMADEQRKQALRSGLRRRYEENGETESVKKTVEPGSKEELLDALGMSPKQRDENESSD